MNLTIPIMNGQTASIHVCDGKTKEDFHWIADHRKVICMRIKDKNSVTAFSYTADYEQNIFVKGIGRNKRKCPKSITLKADRKKW